MNFLSELSRRNVIRIAGLYAIIGWIIVQVIATTAPMLGLPEWFATAVLVLLMAGFPIVALGAWAFDLTPDGIKREESLGADVAPPAPRLVDYSILCGIAVIIVIGIWISVMRPSAPLTETNPTQTANEAAEPAEIVESSDTPVDDRTSIAVLAFEDLSQEQDQEYFADGISEEILNLLVRVEGLQVASRTSSFQFKGRSLGISEIANDLGVGHVLEGSVRRSGDRLRITAQLIDARTDRHLWSENFDRDMTDIFAIQDEIADAIVGALAESLGLSPEEADVEFIAATENLSAYDAYLEGRALFIARNGFERAVQLLERAVELDPNYVEAWENLAASYVIMPAWEFEDRPYLQLAEDAANRAIEIDDTRAMAYAVLGAAIINSDNDIVAGMAYLRMALQRDPRNLTAIDWYHSNLLSFGYMEEARDGFLLCLEIDPSYTKCRNALIEIYAFFGEHEQALAATRQVLSEGYASPSSGVFETFIAAGLRDEAILWVGSNIGYGAPLGAIIDAMIDPENHDVEDAYAQALAYAEANPDLMNSGNLYYLAAHLGVDPLPPVTIEAMLMSGWYSIFSELRNSDLAKESMQNFGLVGYWRANGFPPQCRAIGTDDFECD